MISSFGDLATEIVDGILNCADYDSVLRMQHLDPESTWHCVAKERMGDFVDTTIIDVPKRGLPTAKTLQMRHMMKDPFLGDPFRARPRRVLIQSSRSRFWTEGFSLDRLRVVTSNVVEFQLKSLHLSAANIDFYASLCGAALFRLELLDVTYDQPEHLFRLIRDLFSRSDVRWKAELRSFQIKPDFLEYIVQLYRIGLGHLFHSNVFTVSDGRMLQWLLDAWVETGGHAFFEFKNEKCEFMDLPDGVNVVQRGETRVVGCKVVKREEGQFCFIVTQQLQHDQCWIRVNMSAFLKRGPNGNQ
ncbi:hypothetical protein QR680_010823 [Steinernema hermaphroditum]|uniref:Uncharacterized protein n=1 Tax=Steinernema hermaphroditum TaxID=289476 RepID=A0AA39MCB2_9BILA|nr:hypothetical protein QR680_010823 [Steinernema hermaphroditum]